MEVSENNIAKCFEKLNDRLFEISIGNLVEEYHNKQHVIDAIRYNGIHGLDPEDIQDEITALVSRIKELFEMLPSLVNKQEIKAVTEADRVFEKSLEVIDPVMKKSEILESIKKELKYYQEQLEMHYEYAGKRISSSSKVLSNSGIKLKFNLKVEEIGTLFKGLLDAGVIKLADGITGKEITQEELANWVSKNCSSASKGSISPINVNNCFNYKQSVSILKHFDRIRRIYNRP